MTPPSAMTVGGALSVAPFSARPRRFAALAAAFAVCACAGTGQRPGASGPPPPAPRAGEAIAVSVGPCFGFCPVYDLELSAAGVLRFRGVRHTAVLGSRSRRLGPAAYRDLARDLARFRPEAGVSREVECEASVSDTSGYTVTWLRDDGSRSVATAQDGCPGGLARSFSTLLRGLPVRFGVESWTRQTSRPGEARG